MFVTLVGYPCPRINITAKIYTTICLILIEIILITLTNEITSPRTRKLLAIHEYWPPRIKKIPHYTGICFFAFALYPPFHVFKVFLKNHIKHTFYIYIYDIGEVFFIHNLIFREQKLFILCARCVFHRS